LLNKLDEAFTDYSQGLKLVDQMPAPVLNTCASSTVPYWRKHEWEHAIAEYAGQASALPARTQVKSLPWEAKHASATVIDKSECPSRRTATVVTEVSYLNTAQKHEWTLIARSVPS